MDNPYQWLDINERAFGLASNSEKPVLEIAFSFDPNSGLFTAKLSNGAAFSVSPAHISGKLGSNLDLLRQYTMRDRSGDAPHPHVSSQKSYGSNRDAKLIEEAIAAGKLQKAGVIPDPTINLDLIGG